jgi:hypothetical protein
MPSTPWDDQLRDLLGDHRWQEYAADEHRRDIATVLASAHDDGFDVPALITRAVTCREWEDDPTSPARRVSSVLRYRITSIMASSSDLQRDPDSALPSEVAGVVAGAAAPFGAGSSPHDAETASARPPSRIGRRASRHEPTRD